MKLHSLIFLMILIFSLYVFPQVIDSTDIQTEETLDELLEESFEEEDNSDLYNAIEELILNPIDLNSADIFELQKIPGVTSNIAEIILSYRNKFGPFYSVNELYAMRELDRELIDKIIPFLKVEIKSFQIDSTITEVNFSDEIKLPSKLKLQLRSRYGNDLQTRKGFENGIYVGSKLRAYNRLIVKYSQQIQAGIIFEKDAGEKDFNDFSSFHINVKDIGPISEFYCRRLCSRIRSRINALESLQLFQRS
ncbi:MAG: hypothetical protein KatS3mg036_0029 [Ignavibacterium sp.]|nr:MAG: hypothetical protein KatS3mg036_0029 [Ignavibacterium sp.]